MSSALSLLLSDPLYTGLPVAQTTPLPYPVAINGRGYMLDFSLRGDAPRHRSIPMLRTQADTGDTPGEQSLNPDGLWRRTQSSWHKGAGQTYLDRDDGDPARFRSSKGVNPWTRWQLTLLNSTTLAASSANDNLYLLPVGTYLYYSDDTALKRVTSTSFATPTTITGTSGVKIKSLATDGYNIYITDGADIYSTTRGAAAAAAWSTYDADLLGYVKGRLMAAKGNLVFNITAAAAKTDIVTQPNTDFAWVGFAEGPSSIYMAGYSGDKSLIYKTTIVADGSALAAGVVAGELPDGEIVRSIQGYLGNLLVGSDKGVRFCELDGNGDVLVGDLIPTSAAVYCFEPQDRFVWYGLTNYDSTSTGLGRIDLRTFNDATPAYATDLMATTQGTVQSVVTFGGVRVFSVSGAGFYAEGTVKVSSGTIDSGIATFGIVDSKVGVFAHVHTLPLVGSITAYIALDDGTFQLLGTDSMQDMTHHEWATPQDLSAHFEIRTVLTRFDSSDTVGPSVVRQTLRVNPAAPTGYEILVPIRLTEENNVGGLDQPLIPSEELTILDDLRLTRRVITYQEGNTTYTATVEAIDWRPESLGRGNGELNGLCLVTLHTLA